MHSIHHDECNLTIRSWRRHRSWRRLRRRRRCPRHLLLLLLLLLLFDGKRVDHRTGEEKHIVPYVSHYCTTDWAPSAEGVRMCVEDFSLGQEAEEGKCGYALSNTGSDEWDLISYTRVVPFFCICVYLITDHC